VVGAGGGRQLLLGGLQDEDAELLQAELLQAELLHRAVAVQNNKQSS
jgi:hypothetical protein